MSPQIHLSLRDIKQYLKDGWHPINIPTATLIGSGCQKDAYIIAEYVVKRNLYPAFWTENTGKMDRPAYKYCIPVRQLRKMGICRPRQWYVQGAGGVPWVIQPVYAEIWNPYIPSGGSNGYSTVTLLKQFKITGKGNPQDMEATRRIDVAYSGHNVGLNRHNLMVAYDY